jgi:putative DNA primase/helicase
MSGPFLRAFAAHMAAHGLTPPAELQADGLIHRFSTNGKRGDTAGGYVLHLERFGAGAFWDWRTGLYATWCSHDSATLTPSQRQEFEERMALHRAQAKRDRTAALRKNRARMDALWAQSVPVCPGDPVHRYLRGRGLELRSVPEVLRLHPALDYWDFDADGKPVKRGTYPAMLAAVEVEEFPQGATQPGVLTMVALHRTYLTASGEKAAVPNVKKLTGTAGDMRGSAIRLAPAAVIQGQYRLGVAEGIETALAAAECSGVPTWATVSASGMKSFKWPRLPHALYLFADNDHNETGQRAAKELARKAQACGLAVHTLMPPLPGQDWADIWKARP